MHAQGRKLLKLSGIIEVLFGLALILMLFFALSSTNVDVLKSLGLSGDAQSFINLFTAYTQAFICILAGLLGMAFADKPKHYKVNLFFGIILIVIVLVNMRNKDLSSTRVLLTEAFTLIVPALYVFGAIKNQQSL